MASETPEKREFHVGIEAPEDDAFSMSSASLDDDEYAINNNSLPKHKMAFEEVVDKYGTDYAETRRDYLRHRRTLKAETIGKYRDLTEQEALYFDFMYPRYPNEAM